MLFNSSDIAVWENVLSHYHKALEQHVANKKDDSLLALDEWYQTTLPGLLSSREPKYISTKELCQLMSWKLKRGKFRPQLAKLAASNADVDVKRTSQEAFTLVSSNLKAAITKMAELKGVGPATASAILCAGAPDSVPFMADETMDSVPGLGAIAYTIPYYLKFAAKVIEKADELIAKGSESVNSPHLVEKALWADYMMEKYGIERKTAAPKTSSSTNAKVVTKVESNVKSKEDTSAKRKVDEPAKRGGSSENQSETRKKAKTATATTTATKPTPAKSTRSTRSRS
ncbi:hypothetical protein BGX26_011054 [Mortierella sp. AD094]|nr:hypothetical protein BGX26_011054 [Mortierella sp. AD094]